MMSAADTYRARVEELVAELDVLPRGGPVGDVARLLDEWARLPDVRRLVQVVPGGADRVLRQSLREYASFVPAAASNASSPASLLRILLLQQIDLAWWSTVPDLIEAHEVPGCADLVDLRSVRAGGGVRFGFGVASDRLLRRSRDFLVQRLLPMREPRGAGLSFPYARTELVALLNEMADRVALLAPPGTPRIWVNSIVRTVAHQNRLRALGFTALLPSAHCRGWAADVEMEWFERFRAHGVLREVMLDYQSAGVLNVIDEGRAWHLCLAPYAVGQYRGDDPGRAAGAPQPATTAEAH